MTILRRAVVRRAVLGLLLGAGAMIPMHGPADASPPDGVRADRVERVAATPGRYRVAQYGNDDDDDDNSSRNNSRNDDDDDDDRPQRSYRPPGGTGGGFRPNFQIIIPGGGRPRNEPAFRPGQQPQQYVPRPEKKKQKQEKKRPEKKRPVPPPPPPPPPPKKPVIIPPPPAPIAPAVEPVCAPAGCTDSFQQLRVGATTLQAYRTALPADRNRCAGMTAQGCYLRIMNSAPSCGGQPTCVMHCPPTVPVVVPVCQAVVPPIPVPPPLACATPPCGPPTEQQDPPTDPVPTDVAKPYIEPQPKDPPTDPVPTDVAKPYIEPQPKDPPTDPVPTDVAKPYIEPQPKDPPTDPVPTDVAKPYIEPQPKDPPTDPVPTDVAKPYIEPQPKDPPTDPVPTNVATPKTEPGRKEPDSDPVPTRVAHPYTEPQPKQPDSDPVPTTIATPKTEPDDEADPVDTVTATPVSWIAPWPPNKPRTEPAPPDSGFGFDDASVPVCTPQGAPPATLKLDPQYVRTIVTTAVGVIPDVGKPLSALVQALWKDKTSDSMFDQMKDYVEKLVPELLTKDFQARLGEHLTGINNVLENYKDAEPEDKITYLINLQNAVDLFEPLFIGKGYPADRTIAHFGAFGALKLAVLKELVEHARGPHKRAQQKKLDRKIAEYREHIARIKDELTTKRLSVLKVEHNCTGYRVGRHSRTVCHETAVDPSCNWSGPDRGEDQRAATADLANRREQVRQAYNASLDAVLEPVTRLAAALEREAAASAAATPKP